MGEKAHWARDPSGPTEISGLVRGMPSVSLSLLPVPGKLRRTRIYSVISPIKYTPQTQESVLSNPDGVETNTPRRGRSGRIRYTQLSRRDSRKARERVRAPSPIVSAYCSHHVSLRCFSFKYHIPTVLTANSLKANICPRLNSCWLLEIQLHV